MKFRFIAISLITTILSFLWQSCDSRNHEIMDEADRLIQDHPDSALSVLKQIDRSTLSGESDLAYFSLLWTEAAYKSYTENVSDSIISIATDHYNKSIEDPRRGRSFYYKGISDLENGKYIDAIISLKKSEKTARHLSDTRQLAFIHRAMGNCFANMQNPTTALDYYKMSFNEFKESDNIKYLPNALYDIARCYYNNRAYDSCIILADKVLKSTEKEKDIHLVKLTLKLKGNAAVQNGDYKNGMVYFDSLRILNDGVFDISDIPFVGEAEIALGNKDYVKTLVDSLYQAGQSDNWTKLLHAKCVNDYENAYTLATKIREEDIDKFNNWLRRDYETSLISRYELENKNIIIESRYNNLILILLLTILILIIILILWRLQFVKKKHSAAIRENLDSILMLDEEIRHQKELIAVLDSNVKNSKEMIRDDFGSQFSLFNKLLKKYSDHPNSSARQKCMYEEILKEIENLRKNRKVLREMKRLVNIRFDNIMDNLKKDFPDLSEDDEKLLLYSISGLSGKSMGILLDQSPEYLYNKKHSLKDMINNSDSENKKKYQAFF